MAAKPCLLVVDDEPDLVQSLKDLLRFDYRVLGATRASEGLRIVANEDVQVVMSDQRMPEMSGVEFLSCLRQSHPDLVRLLFTAFSDLKAVTDAINQGSVYRYITKPFEADELKTVLRQAVEHYNLQAERRRLLIEVQEANRLLQKANGELLEANELKRAFIRVASHELRTPLTVVMGLSELARDRSTITGPEKGWFEQIHRSSQRLNQRVDQMVTLMQTEHFERPLVRQNVPFADLANRAAQEALTFASHRKQNLIADIPDDLGTIFVEPEKIQDAIVQLLMNAIKFTPDGGTIELSAARLGDFAEIRVKDDGQGISAESLPHIFDPFFTKFDVSHHRSGTYEFNTSGLGLGLPVVKAFIEMHGGSVSVESKPGAGTLFRFTVPAK